MQSYAIKGLKKNVSFQHRQKLFFSAIASDPSRVYVPKVSRAGKGVVAPSLLKPRWVNFADTKSFHETSEKDIPEIDISKMILFEDNHLLVLSKPSMVLTQGDDSGQPNVLDAAKKFLVARDRKPGEAFLGLVHRLDRPVSGVLVFAKTSKAAARLSESFRDRKVEKCYLCVVNGHLSGNGRCDNMLLPTSHDNTLIVDRLAEHPHKMKKAAVAGMVDGRLKYESVFIMDRVPEKSQPPDLIPGGVKQLAPAKILRLQAKTPDSTNEEEEKKKIDKINLIKSKENKMMSIESEDIKSVTEKQTLLRIVLETGRKHQIRAQMAHKGHPIVGDVRYGAPQSFKSRDIALHAHSLAFPHPISAETVRFLAPPPQSWLKRFGPAAMAAAKNLKE